MDVFWWMIATVVVLLAYVAGVFVGWKRAADRFDADLTQSLVGERPLRLFDRHIAPTMVVWHSIWKAINGDKAMLQDDLKAAKKKVEDFADDLVEERAKVEALKVVRDTQAELNATQAGMICDLRSRVAELEEIAAEAGTYDYRPQEGIETPIEFYRIPIPATDPTAAEPINTLWGPM